MTDTSFLGFGLGLRPAYYQTILDTTPNIDWFEIVTEDYLIPGGPAIDYLQQIRQRFSIVMHGVSLSIGSCDSLNWDYLEQVKSLADWLKPAWISDHLCWTGVDGINTHDLLPLPRNETTIDHVVDRIQQVQRFLGQRILLENISTYIEYKDSEMPEWEFLATIAERADCLILLDINNIYVNAQNHQFDPEEYIAQLPKNRIQQFHLAGHQFRNTHIVDTHDQPIIDPVWKLYEQAFAQFGPVSTMIERDANMPSLDELIAELDMARYLAQQTMSHAT